MVTNADEYAKIRAVNASVTVRVKEDARDDGETTEREGGGAERDAIEWERRTEVETRARCEIL